MARIKTKNSKTKNSETKRNSRSKEIQKEKRVYKRKKVKINKNKLGFSPYLIDLRNKERAPKQERIIKEKSKKNKEAPISFKKNKLLDFDIDFLKAREKFIVPENLGQKTKEAKIENRKEDIPYFLNGLVLSNNTIFHRALNSFSNLFNHRPLSPKIKATVAFVLACSILILPIKASTFPNKLQERKQNVLAKSVSGYRHLKNAQKALTDYNFDLSKKEFSLAEKEFNIARGKVGFWKVFIPFAKLFSKEVSGYYLIEAGEKIAFVGGDFSDKMIDFKKELSFDTEESVFLDFNPLLKSLEHFQEEKKQTLSKLNRIETCLKKVDKSIIPKEEILKIEEMRSRLDRIFAFIEVLPNILGEKGLKRYLFIFQNSNEIRATGGFMGSLALVDIAQGEIKNIEIPSGGPYDFRAGFKENIISPQPLWRANPRWEIQDANWWPDFPTSAKKIIWFYEKSGGPTVDGITAVNVHLITDLLKIVGPIEMPEYNETITADNFIEETQKKVELEYNREENKPKQFIADLFFEILEKISENLSLKNEEKMKFAFNIIQLLDEGFSKKQVQCYFIDKKTEKNILNLDIGGEIKDSIRDYLMIINTNIGGGKTDEVIKQVINLESKVQEDNFIINTLTIDRTHQGEKGDLFTGDKNNNYLRVYLPKNSILIETNGFVIPGPGNFAIPDETLKEDKDLAEIEKNIYFDKSGTKIYNEFSKTVFAHWIEVEPGQNSTAMLKYKLPFKFDNNYSLFIQKQSGSRNVEFSAELILPDGQIYNFKSNLEKDEFWQPM